MRSASRRITGLPTSSPKTAESVDTRRNVAISVIDEAELLGIQLRGEAASVGVDVPTALTGIFADKQRGFYAEAIREFGRRLVRTMPESFFGLKVRVDYADFDID